MIVGNHWRSHRPHGREGEQLTMYVTYQWIINRNGINWTINNSKTSHPRFRTWCPAISRLDIFRLTSLWCRLSHSLTLVRGKPPDPGIGEYRIKEDNYCMQLSLCSPCKESLAKVWLYLIDAAQRLASNMSHCRRTPTKLFTAADTSGWYALMACFHSLIGSEYTNFQSQGLLYYCVTLG